MNKFRVPRSLWLAGGAALVVGLLATTPWELTRLNGATDGAGDAAVPDAGADQAATGGGQRNRDQQRLPSPLPPEGYPWWRDAELQQYVGLKPEQVQRIETIYDERDQDMRPFIIEWRHQREEFNNMARAREASVAQFAIQSARFEALNTKLRETRAVMLYRMSLELSAEQYQKLQELQEHRDRRGRSGGRNSGPNR